MSALAEQARSKAREKVQRLTRSNTGKVDASGWREPLGQQSNVQTGPRPVSRRQFRSGGKVHGEHSEKHAGRKARASGGMTAEDYINRNVKSANESREGPKHVGGMKHGGSCRCSKCGGGSVGKAAGGGISPRTPSSFSELRHKDGSRVEGGGFREKAVPRAAARNMLKMNAADMAGDRTKSGKPPYKAGGSVGPSYGGSRPEGDRIARKGGGRAKKAMNVNIIIAPSGGHAPAAMPGAPPPPPPGGPVGMRQGVPPPAMPPAGAGAPMGPPMMRKSGGRAYPIEHGAGGGKGRLEKARAYGG